MGLLRRNARLPSPPGDWMDALQAAMWVDPALKPKRDPRPGEEPLDGPATGEPLPRYRLAEVPRRFRPSTPLSGPPSDVDPAPTDKPWLTPIPPPRPPASTTRGEAGAAAALTTAPVPGPFVAAATPAPAAVEQLLQWVCRLSRMRRAGATALAADNLRFEAEHHLTAVAAAGPVGGRLRGPMASLVDIVMTRGGLPVAGPWVPLGPTPPEPAYRAAAEEDAADPAGLTDGTWAAHHAALSLVADLVPDGPAVLHALDAKLHGAEPSVDARICPDAYQGLFDHDLVRPAARPVRAVAAAAVGLLLASVAGAVLLNVRYVGQLRSSVDAVDRTLRAPVPAAAKRVS